MKIGVKTFDSEKFLKHFENKADFFEIMAIQKNDYFFLKKFSLPIVVHAEHQSFGVNLADSSKKKQNLNSINFAIKIADLTNSRKIIVHPGVIEEGNKNCSKENAFKLLKEINDNRILIENLPKESSGSIKGTSFCSTPLEAKKFIKETKTGFCFDVNHAISSMNAYNLDYSFIKKYLELNPNHYHLGGQKLNEKNAHLCFADSTLNLREILKYYPKDAEITLETETDIKKVENDIKFVRTILTSL